MEQWGYRLMMGRQGASGYIRQRQGLCCLTARGLRPGQEYTARALHDGEEKARAKADGDGCAVFTGPFFQPMFVSCGGEPILWEGEETAFLAACQYLKRRETPPTERPVFADPPETGKKPLSPPPELPEEPQEKLPEEPPKETPKEPPKEPRQDTLEETPDGLTEEAGENSEQSEEPPFLRPPGEGRPVDALPALFWPRGTEEIRQLSRSCPPVRPFDVPGWRFVRAPSPIRQVPYCVVGYRQEGDRVTAVAHAVPGNPYRPPAALRGYSYRQAGNGIGYWVTERNAEEPAGG